MSNKTDNQDENRTEQLYKEFEEFFGGLMPSLRNIKLAGHIGSAFTQGYAIFLISQSQLSIENKSFLIVVGVAIAIFFSFLIEGGIAKIAPYFFRILVRWKFQNKWFISMFAFLLIVFVIPLIYYSTTLSKVGGFTVIDESKTEIASPNYTAIDEHYNHLIDAQNTTATNKKQDIKTSINIQKGNKTGEYKNLVAVQEGIKKKNQKLYDTGLHNWAKGHVHNAKIEIKRLQAKEQEALNLLEGKKSNESKYVDSLATVNITNLQKERLSERQTAKAQFETDKLAQQDKVNLWGRLLGSLALFCVIGSLSIIFIEEIFKAGSGKDYEKKKDLPNRRKRITGRIYDLADQLGAKLEEKLNIDLNKDGYIGAPIADMQELNQPIDQPITAEIAPPYQAPTAKDIEDKIAAALDSRFPKAKPILGFRPASTDNIPPKSQLEAPTPTAISTPIELPLTATPTPIHPTLKEVEEAATKAATSALKDVEELIKEAATKTATSNDKIIEEAATKAATETATKLAAKSGELIEEAATKLAAKSGELNQAFLKSGGELTREVAATSKAITLATTKELAAKSGDLIKEAATKAATETANHKEWTVGKKIPKKAAKKVAGTGRKDYKENRAIILKEYKRLLKAEEKVNASVIARNTGIARSTVRDHLTAIKAE